MNMLII